MMQSDYMMNQIQGTTSVPIPMTIPYGAIDRDTDEFKSLKDLVQIKDSHIASTTRKSKHILSNKSSFDWSYEIELPKGVKHTKKLNGLLIKNSNIKLKFILNKKKLPKPGRPVDEIIQPLNSQARVELLFDFPPYLLNKDILAIAELQSKKIPPTDDSPKYKYSADEDKKGLDADYHFEKCVGKIVAIRQYGKFVDKVESGDTAAIILDKTCFYAEQGGQIYDVGFFSKVGGDNTTFNVTNTQIRGGYIVFVGSSKGTFKVGDNVKQQFDEPRRKLIMKNRTGTHVLNYALKKVLMDVDQKGSLVAEDRMRFDFTANGALTSKQVKDVEETAQKVIDTHKPVYAKGCKLAEAKEINGLRAVFDEAYPDPVRVVCVGTPVEKLLENPTSDLGTTISVEFCGGTHLKNVGHIGNLVISSVEIIKGVYRIIALTGPEAERAIQRAEKIEKEAKAFSKRINSDKDIAKDKTRYQSAVKELNELNTRLSPMVLPQWRKDAIKDLVKATQKQLDTYAKEAKAVVEKQVIEEAKKLANALTDEKVVVHVFPPGADRTSLNLALNHLKKRQALMALSIDEDDGEVVIVATVSKALAAKGFKAPDWINRVGEVIAGRGGGKDLQAQANGDKIGKLDEAVKLAKEFAQVALG